MISQRTIENSRLVEQSPMGSGWFWGALDYLQACTYNVRFNTPSIPYFLMAKLHILYICIWRNIICVPHKGIYFGAWNGPLPYSR